MLTASTLMIAIRLTSSGMMYLYATTFESQELCNMSLAPAVAALKAEKDTVQVVAMCTKELMEVKRYKV